MPARGVVGCPDVGCGPPCPPALRVWLVSGLLPFLRSVVVGVCRCSRWRRMAFMSEMSMMSPETTRR